MSTPPPSVPPKKSLLPSVTLPSVRPPEQPPAPQPVAKRLRTETQQSNGSQLDNVIASLSTWRASQPLHHPPQLAVRPPPRSDTTISSGPPPTLTTTTKPSDRPPDSDRRSIERQPSTTSALPKEGRRVWNRRLLEQNGASQTLLKALDAFIANVPVIPTHMDPSRKIYVRNMRGWIMHLGLPVHNSIWEALITVLRTDTSLAAVGLHWDHDLCRFILGKIVLDNQTKQQHQNQPKQTRQAINNAIKRELTCPSESGNSSRGKTFRDLFRQKCKESGIEVPPIEHTARTKRAPDADKSAPQAETTAPSSSHVAHSQTRAATAAGEDSYVSLPLPNTAGKPPPGVVDDSELSRLRIQCAETDEWNRTAWWRLTNDDDVKRLPFLLAHSRLYELHSLLTEFRWIARTFHCVDFSRGMRQVPTDGYDVMLKYAQRPDAERSPLDVEGFRLIRNAIMLILPILSKETTSDPSDPTFIAHLATQLVGRLLDLKRRFPNIACLIRSTEEHAPRPWLRPLTRCFHQPRTDIKLAVPSNGIFTPHLIVLSEDGTLLATSGTSIVPVKPEPSRATTSTPQRSTSSKDSIGTQLSLTRKISSVVIWDVQSGKCMCKGPEIPNLVRHLSLSRDNNCIIGETVDGLFFWHLDKSKEMWTISLQVEATPRIKSVSSITAAVGSSRVLTTHRLPQEPMIVLWDTKTGQKLDAYDRVTSNANCVDVSARGDYFASGHDNGFIHLWTMSEKVPVLSFKNEGADRGPQQVVALADVNRTGTTQYPTISISFYEKGEERWLTTVSANHIIRVWLLPPQHISHNQWKSFVSSRRTAVLKCPRIRDVQWSQNGNFFTGGDDGIARMWRKLESGKWEWYAIDKENGEKSLDLSTVLLSCGKRSQLVATYVTKSPYVTVWDMSRMGRDMRSRKRGSLYRAYLPLIANSIDATDIRHLTALERTMGPRRSEAPVKDSKWMSTYGDNIGLIRTELGKFFVNLDTKSSTKPDGEMQPWLRMQPSGGVSGMEGPEQQALRVCFEQPVITGQSGVFKADSGETDTSIGDMYAMGTDGGGWEPEEEVERRGMVAALQDGTIGMFELEGVKFSRRRLGAKEEVEAQEKAGGGGGHGRVAQEEGAEGVGGREPAVVREKSGVAMESLQLPESRYRERSALEEDTVAGGLDSSGSKKL